MTRLPAELIEALRRYVSMPGTLTIKPRTNPPCENLMWRCLARFRMLMTLNAENCPRTETVIKGLRGYAHDDEDGWPNDRVDVDYAAEKLMWEVDYYLCAGEDEFLEMTKGEVCGEYEEDVGCNAKYRLSVRNDEGMVSGEYTFTCAARRGEVRVNFEVGLPARGPSMTGDLGIAS